MHQFRALVVALSLVSAAVGISFGQATITFSPEVQPPFTPSGNWHEPLDWSPAIVPNDGQADVIIAAGTVFLNADAAIGTLLLEGPSGAILQGGDDTRKTLTVSGRSTWTGGSISSDVNIHAYGGIDLSGSENKQINTGTSGGNFFKPIIRVRGDSTWEGGNVFGQLVGDDLDGRPLFDFQSGTFTVTGGSLFTPQLLNAGTVNIDPGDGAETSFDFFTNNGTVNILSGTTDLDAFLSDGDPQPTSTGAFIIGQDASLLLAGHTLADGGSISGAGNVVLSGSVDSDLVTVAGDYGITGVTSLFGDVIFEKDATTGGLIVDGFGGEITGKITASSQVIWEDEDFGGTGEIVAQGGIDFVSDDNIQLNDSLTLTLSGASSWTGTGRVDLANTSQIRQLAGGTWTINGNRTLVDVSDDGEAATFSNAGTLILTSGRTFIRPDSTNTGDLIIQTGAMLEVEVFAHSGGDIRLEGGTISGGLTVTGGRIIGNGAVFAAMVATDTTIAPGAAGSSGTGELEVGRLTLGSGCVLAVDLGGTAPSEYDRVVTDLGSFNSRAGDITLGGSLQIRFHSGFQNGITAADTFTIAEARLDILGAFANAAPGSRLATADGMGSFIVDYGPTSPTGENRVVLRSFEASANPPEEPKITSITVTPTTVTLAWFEFGNRTNYTVESSTSVTGWTPAKVITDGATTTSFPRVGTRRFFRVTSP